MLGQRRSALVRFAPLFWKPNPDAASAHRAFLEKLLTRGAAVGYRTPTSVLIAAAQAEGWNVDDAHVPDGRWVDDPDATEMWARFVEDHRADRVRMVCPVYEPARADFAAAYGLSVANTWWLRELPGSEGGTANERVALPGATAVTVSAPPVYAPPGPMLFLPEVADPWQAITPALEVAARRGCAGVVVDHHPGEDALEAALIGAGFRAHCAYYTGPL